MRLSLHTPKSSGTGFLGSFDSFFLDRLVASKRGRAFLLNFMADAEESDEQGVFEDLLSRVDDPALSKLVRRHRDDEARHAQMLKECVARVGVSPEPVPSQLRIVARIDSLLGGFAKSFVSGQRGVMEAYIVLQVIEERGVKQFPKIAQALQKVDPESAEVIMRITQDEERHVKYAEAISRRYAPDEATLSRLLSEVRQVEERAFLGHSQDFLRFAISQDLLDVRGPERFFWKFMVSLVGLSSRVTRLH